VDLWTRSNGHLGTSYVAVRLLLVKWLFYAAFVVPPHIDPRHVHIAPGERFAEVTFDLDGDALHSPRWRHRERAEVERLIGGPISLPVESSY